MRGPPPKWLLLECFWNALNPLPCCPDLREWVWPSACFDHDTLYAVVCWFVKRCWKADSPAQARSWQSRLRCCLRRQNVHWLSRCYVAVQRSRELGSPQPYHEKLQDNRQDFRILREVFSSPCGGLPNPSCSRYQTCDRNFLLSGIRSLLKIAAALPDIKCLNIAK